MGQFFSCFCKCLRSKLRVITNDHDQNYQQQEPQQQSFYFTIDTIPNAETVRVPKPDTVASTPTEVEVPSVVVDLSNVDVENEAESGDKVIQVVAEGNKHDYTKTSNNNNNNNVATTSNETKVIKRIGSYNNMQTILLVGEGDFSFSASLAVAFGSASNIIATSLNSKDFLVKNYQRFFINKMELESRGGMVIHDVNAKTLVKHCVLGSLKFDRIIFNFPHSGKFGTSDADLRANQELLRGFLSSAKKMINKDGEIHIRHKSSSFFLQWDIPKIGSDQGLRLIQEVKFNFTDYPGYRTKYGFGGDKNFNCNPCKTYKFGLRPK